MLPSFFPTLSPVSLPPLLSPPPPPLKFTMLLSLPLLCVFLWMAGCVRALAVPVTPSQDPFYTPPPGFQATPPGTVLKSRTIIPAGLGLIVDILSFQTYQILYRTTAVNGAPIATVTTVFIPLLAPKDRMVAYNVFEDSAAPQCAPSYNYQFLSTAPNLLAQADLLTLQAYLLKNWIVAAADHEGPDSAFAAGRIAGQAVLDGIRAVKNFAPVGLQKNAKVVASGYSGGAIATGWAAGLKNKYASELNIVGWATGGTPANLTGTFVNIDGTLFAGFLPAAIDGVISNSAYPQLQPLINRIATAKGKTELQFAATHCAVDDIVSFAYQRVQTITFNTEGDRVLYDSQIVAVLNDNLMGRNRLETPTTAPVFLYHSTMDEVIPYANASTLVNTWCNNGAKIQFNTYTDSGHLGTAIRALGDVLSFIDSAFAGTANFKTCTSTTVPSTPFTLPFELEPVAVGLLNILVALGNGDANANPALLNSTVPTSK